MGFGTHLAEEPWMQGWKAQPLSSGWGLSFCLLWKNRGWGVTSWISVTSLGAMERDMPLCSPVPGAVAMTKAVPAEIQTAHSKVPRGWSSNGQISSGGGECPKLGSDWVFNTVPLKIHFWSTPRCSGSWTDDLCWSLPFGIILFCSIWFDSKTCIYHVCDWQGTAGDQLCSAVAVGI